jgi:hypothetical protein
MNENTIATCIVCRVGTYQPNSGQTKCTQCPKGFTTVQEGSIQKTQCQGRQNLKVHRMLFVIYSCLSLDPKLQEYTVNFKKTHCSPSNTLHPVIGMFHCLFIVLKISLFSMLSSHDPVIGIFHCLFIVLKISLFSMPSSLDLLIRIIHCLFISF